MQPLKTVSLSYILELQEFIWGDVKKKKKSNSILWKLKKKKPVFVYVYVYTLYVCDYLAMQKI